MIKQFILRFGLVIFAVIMLCIALFFSLNKISPQPAAPTIAMPQSPFKQTVAGIGVIEPENGIIRIASSAPGTVSAVYVEAGQRIKTGDALFKIDDTELKAEKKWVAVQLDSAKKELKDIRDHQHEHRAVLLAQAKVDEADARLAWVTARLNKLLVKSPLQGTVLQVNVHPGESANASLVVMVLGKIDKVLRVKVEIDEADAARIQPNARAVGMLPGKATQPIDLNYVQSYPLVESKKALSNQGNELIDTRVMQILFTFDNSTLHARPGQQMDVFIDASP